jgi:hypothetical protein
MPSITCREFSNVSGPRKLGFTHIALAYAIIAIALPQRFIPHDPFPLRCDSVFIRDIHFPRFRDPVQVFDETALADLPRDKPSERVGWRT